MQIDEIKAIIELMKENGLTEFELEEAGVRLCLRRGVENQVAMQQSIPLHPLQQGATSTVSNETNKESESLKSEVDESRFVIIKAPFVGTFYRAPSPEAPPYVTVGQEVNPDTVLCILEAMKVMNEIKAEVSGIVREIFVENAHAVQYGQPLFKIEKK